MQVSFSDPEKRWWHQVEDDEYVNIMYKYFAVLCKDAKSFASKNLGKMFYVFRIFKCIHWQTVHVSVKGQLN